MGALGWGGIPDRGERNIDPLRDDGIDHGLSFTIIAARWDVRLAQVEYCADRESGHHYKRRCRRWRVYLVFENFKKMPHSRRSEGHRPRRPYRTAFVFSLF